MIRLRASLLFVTLGFVSAEAIAQRRVDYVLHSDSLPALAVQVSSEFSYLGQLSYDVQGAAEASEYVFADTSGGTLRRAFIAHFEHFLPASNQTFNYPRLTMARLGEHEYLHQTWAIRDFDLFRVPAMQDFLSSRRLRADSSWLVDRYVRAVDAAKTHEVIFFYLEAASINDRSIHYGGAPFEPPPPPAPPPSIRAAFLERAAHAFTVTDRP